jgi:hypothetical protein
MGICRRSFGKCVVGGITGALLGATARPKLLVMVVLEQFRPDYLDLIRPQLVAGGFRKLLEKGAVFNNCLHAASTFSSSSLATLATGAWPAVHGIVADRWYDPTIKTAISPSEEELQATTLAAQLAPDPQARVTVISLDRAYGALWAGTPDARLFWLDEQGHFATNSDIPDWLGEFNAQKAAETVRNLRWLAIGAKPDAPPLRTLSYSADHPQDFLALYRGSPFGQAAQFDLLTDLVVHDNMGKSDRFEVVCLIAGSMGQLGYETGARGPLMQQMTMHLDRRIESLLGVLAKTPGDGAFNLALVGAHGAPPAPSTETRDRMTVSGEQVAQAVDRALTAWGSGRVDKYVYPFLYLNTDGYRDPEPIREAAARAALRHPAVAGYLTAGGACSVRDPWERRFRNSFHPTRSGDVMLSYRPEYVESFGDRRGISYGSLYNYDARVPLCLYGPQFRAGQFEQTVEAVDVAPTLARVMGVAPPSSSTGRVLAEALAE